MVLVKSVKPLPDGWLYITFDNEEKKIVDIKPHMKGVLEKLKDSEFFKQVFVDPELESVSWPEEIDLDPDNLYKQGINIGVIENLSKILSKEKLAGKIKHNRVPGSH
ncbi:DUF2442 domain-containing protein [Sporosarcina highlanderae]|uniref:DUF2442 domain-containing protein n=1 Tax=Sporosarcina highlanderae TaxID=3035916 RepID=A0ABT8JP15_9BACL|nr:DUF2442 domain-containing protein [Sporosarcina highlanderae]MDN4605909.1 DUF2442 domain-containing protein [Sporosarcina highlanderae]